MEKIELSIVALAQSETQSNSFIVLLKEEVGARRLPIVIGGFEAQAIALAVEGIQPNRPMTHDLLADVIENLGARIEKIVISDLRQHVFYARIHLLLNGRTIEIDSRPSDAIALGVASNAPIHVADHVFDQAAQ